MSSGGQRQDIAFLALAVAVLAVAFALFIGLRSIGGHKRAEPESEPVEEVEVAEPEAAEPATSETGRDPFKTQVGVVRSSTAPGGAPDVKLVGIVMEQGDKPIAIIHSGRKRYYASVGDRAAGYTVVSVSEGRAVLERDGGQVTLVLREPEPTE